jgi:Acyl dehydratase
VTITQERVHAFADATDDHQFIHVDPQRAKEETPYGGTIAHGFLTCSLLPFLSSQCLPRVAHTVMGINYGFDRLRFLAPVAVGAQLRASFVLADLEVRKPTEISLHWDVTMQIKDHDKPAMVARWITQRHLAHAVS